MKQRFRVVMLSFLSMALVFPLGVANSGAWRDAYMSFIMKVYPPYFNEAVTHQSGGRHLGNLDALREEFLFKAVNDRDTKLHAWQTMRFLRTLNQYLDSAGPHPSVGSVAGVDVTEAYLGIRNSPVLSASDHKLARDLILRLEDVTPRPFEYGAHNRPMEAATQRRLISLLYPDAPQSAVLSDGDLCNNDRACYERRVWDDWAAFSDNYENSIHYNGIWWTALMKWYRADQQFGKTQGEGFFGQAGVRSLVYRYLNQVSPLGIMPSYGDTVGLNYSPGVWIRLMEDWAHIYGDGQFKWVAHRMFGWSARRKKDMDQWGNITVRMMDDLMGAYLEADESIPERRPEIGSTLTYRHRMEFSPADSPYPVLRNDLIPDKLVLRSGWEPDDFYALINLTPYMGHGHLDAGAVDMMTSNDSVLLTDTPYLVKDAQFHNAFILTPDGFTMPNSKYQNADVYAKKVISKVATTVNAFKDGPLGTFASVNIAPYMGHDGTLNRRFLFVNNQFLWVQDNLKAITALQAMVGPAWQTVEIDKQRGPNWLNTRLSAIPVSDIWKPQYLMRWTNKPWDLLVIFPQADEGQIKIDDVSHDTTHQITSREFQNNLNVRIWEQKHITLAANETVRFNSVLLPHAPGTSSAEWAQRFKVVLNSGEQSVLAYSDSSGATWFVGMNDKKASMWVGPFRTDAEAFMVRTRGSKIEQFWYTGGTFLK